MVFFASSKMYLNRIIIKNISVKRFSRRFLSITQSEIEFLEAEAKRSSVKPVRTKNPKSITNNSKTPEENDVNFSDKYLSSKGIEFNEKSINAVSLNPSSEIDPNLLSEISRWDFISSQEDEATKKLLDTSDMASKVRQIESAEHETKAAKSIEYKIPGRISEKDLSVLLNSYRKGEKVESIIESNGIDPEVFSLLCKNVKAPIFQKNIDDGTYYICI